MKRHRRFPLSASCEQHWFLFAVNGRFFFFSSRSLIPPRNAWQFHCSFLLDKPWRLYVQFKLLAALSVIGVWMLILMNEGDGKHAIPHPPPLSFPIAIVATFHHFQNVRSFAACRWALFHPVQVSVCTVTFTGESFAFAGHSVVLSRLLSHGLLILQFWRVSWYRMVFAGTFKDLGFCYRWRGLRKIHWKRTGDFWECNEAFEQYIANGAGTFKFGFDSVVESPFFNSHNFSQTSLTDLFIFFIFHICHAVTIRQHFSWKKKTCLLLGSAQFKNTLSFNNHGTAGICRTRTKILTTTCTRSLTILKIRRD